MPYQSRRQQGNKLHNDKNMITDNSVAVSSNNGGNGNDGNGSIDSASQKKKDRDRKDYFFVQLCIHNSSVMENSL